MVVVKFKNGATYFLDNDKIRETSNVEKIDIYVVEKITKEDFDNALRNNLKLFECKDSPEICLSRLYNILFSKKKSCKFA